MTPARALRLLIVVAVLAAVASWLLLRGRADRRAEPPPSPEPPPRAYYVELHEVNTDDFPASLFVSQPPGDQPPFVLSQGRILVTARARQAIAEGREREAFRLTLDTTPLRLEQDARLFLVHQVRFAGVGREGSVADYYIFSRFPARLELPAREAPPEGLHLGLHESIAETFEIRLLPAGALQLSEPAPGRLEAALAEASWPLPEAQDVRLSQRQHTAMVTQMLVAPIPKGEIRKEDIRLAGEDYGQVEFSTELSLRNAGRYEVVVEASEPAGPPQPR